MRNILEQQKSYMEFYNKLSKDEQKYIDAYSNFDYLFIKYNKVIFKVSKLKNNQCYIGGLISLEKGEGRRVFDWFVKNNPHDYSIFRLNCIGNKLREYYENIGFKVLYSMPSADIKGETFYEMIYYKDKK